jgi:hypothetical protein
MVYVMLASTCSERQCTTQCSTKSTCMKGIRTPHNKSQKLLRVTLVTALFFNVITDECSVSYGSCDKYNDYYLRARCGRVYTVLHTYYLNDSHLSKLVKPMCASSGVSSCDISLGKSCTCSTTTIASTEVYIMNLVYYIVQESYCKSRYDSGTGTNANA